jgi:SPX domain protein involved in polyphosphate accumulation
MWSNQQHVIFFCFSPSDFNNQMNKVENFYVGKLQELKDHLRVLVEDTKTILPTIPTRKDSDSSTTTKRWKTLTTSIMEKWHSALKQSNAQLQYQQQSHRRLFSEPSYGNIQHYGSLVTHDSDDENLSITMYSSNASAAVRPGEAESIKRALADLYRWAKLLENYSILNYTGFVKIIKRHDKNFPSEKDKFRNVFNSSTTVYSFSSSIDAEKLCEHMETIFAKWFCKGNRREAAIKILPKKGDGLDMDWSQLRLGFRLGMCTILLLWVCWDCIWGFVAQGQSTIGGTCNTT